MLCLALVFWTAWPALRQPRLEGDDYRYLHAVQQMRSGSGQPLMDSLVVENRWDHLWFMAEEGRVRFFRPVVAASYAVDAIVWGDHHALGLTLTNVLIHLACAWVLCGLFHRWLGPGWAALTASLLFAGHWSHGECIWYIAGRTDSLAALCFLGALSLHATGRPGCRWGAVPVFACGLLTKELVIAAPVLFILHDLWVDRRRPEIRLYTSYALIAALVLGLKQWALGGASSDMVYPYLIHPFGPHFPEHIWLQIRSYSANLILAQWTAPFADRAAVTVMNSLAGCLLLGGVVVTAGILHRRDGRFWFLLLLGLATWLPVSFVYLSERYLYLPSAALCGLLGLLTAGRPRAGRAVLCSLLGVYAVFHAVRLHEKHGEICSQPGSIREMAAQLEPIRSGIGPGDQLLLVNLPGPFLRAQFIEETLRVLLDDPVLSVQVLTMMPGQNGTVMLRGDPPPDMGRGAAMRQTDKDRFILEAAGGQRLQEYERFPFAWSRLEDGRVYQTPEMQVRVAAAETRGAERLDCTLFRPLSGTHLLLWRADPDYTLHPWVRRARADIQLISL
jgi:hypothetical protein